MAKRTAEEQDDFAALYGWSRSVLRGNPELSKLFDTAMNQNYNQSRFVAALRGTKWYRTRAESVRQGEILRKADPGEYNARVKAAAQSIADQYFQMTGRRMGGPTAAHLGQTAMLYGFNDAEVRDLVGNTVSSAALMKQGIGGTLGDAEKQIRSAAASYGIDLSPTYVMNAVNNIAWQNTDVTAETEKLRRMAKSRYPQYAQQLDEGGTIKDIAEEYRQLMSKTLEIPDQSIAIGDRHIQSALTYRPPAKAQPGGKPAAPDGPPAGMPLWQFEQNLKSDPRWLKTKNAQDANMAAARQVIQDLGFEGGSN